MALAGGRTLLCQTSINTSTAIAMAKHYNQYEDHSSSSSERTLSARAQKMQFRRVWVKRITGTPTTIMISPDQIVDDLKQAVVHKFPNSLARHFDPAEIQILVRATTEKSGSQGRRTKRKAASRNSVTSSDDAGSRAGASGESLWVDSYIILAPDQNVWEVVNEYYGGSMNIDDAFIVDVDANEQLAPAVDDPFPILFNQDPRQRLLEKLPLLLLRLADTRSPTSLPEHVYHHPKPQYPQNANVNSNTVANGNYGNLNHNYSSASSNVSHNVNHSNNAMAGKGQYHKNLSASPNFGSRMGLVYSTSNALPQRQPPTSSSPGPFNSPAKILNSQPVLLLPKNFSLGDQNSHKAGAAVDDPLRPAATTVKSPGAQELHKTHSQSHSIDSTRHSDEKSLTAGGLNGHTEHKALPLSKTSSKSHLSNAITRSLDGKAAKTKEKTPLSTFEKVLPLISVLVVEDNSINQAILGAFLRKHKIHYHIAKNGQEAIDKWRKGGFHLVLMDIQLPVKSGIEATKEIRNLERVNRIGVFAQHELAGGQGNEEVTDDQRLDINLFRSPVIIVALTASSNSSVDRKNALTAGCNDFLTKPVNLVWLQNKITEWGCMQALIDFDGWKDKRNATLNTSGKDIKV